MATVMSCGTGNWTGPLPGDPDNNSILSAVPAFGGIDVSWTYPNINPHAVAHVLLYRGISDNYAASVKQATVAGNIFYDRITGTAGTRYYYWIQIVSVNGTVGEAIGPASAVARDLGEDLVIQLSGKIEESALGTSLRGSIDDITLNYTELVGRIGEFSGNNTAFMDALVSVQNGLTNALTLLDTEITQRTLGQSALLSQQTVLAALNQVNVAAILEEQTVRVNADSALAQTVAELGVANTEGIAAAVKTLESTKIGYSGKLSTEEPYEGDGTFIVYPESTYPSVIFPDYALKRTRIIDKAGVTAWNIGNALQLKWVVGLPLAQAVKSVGISDGVDTLTVEQRATAQKQTNGTLLGQYTVKVNAGNVIAGFGLASTSTAVGNTTSSFLVQADAFALMGSVNFSQEDTPLTFEVGNTWHVPSTKVFYRYTETGPGTGAWLDYVPVTPFGVDAITNTTYINGEVRINAGGAKLQDSVKNLRLTTTGYAFVYADAAATTTPSPTLIFTANVQNMTGIATFVATAYNAAGVSLGAITLGGANNIRTLSGTQFNSLGATTTRYVKVVATLGGLSDTTTIYRGDGGANAITAILSNEAHVVPASSNGTVSTFSGASTIIKIFEGLVDTTHLWTFAATTLNVGGTFNGLALPVVTGFTSVASPSVVVNTLSADTGTVTITATRSGYPTQTKVFSLSKSIAGTDGAGTDGARGSITAFGTRFGITASSWPDLGDGATTATEKANAVIWNTLYAPATNLLNTPNTWHLRIGDQVTLSNGSSFAQMRYWGGTSWLTPGVVIDGNLLVSGTVSADKISAGTITAAVSISSGGYIKASQSAIFGGVNCSIMGAPTGLGVHGVAGDVTQNGVAGVIGRSSNSGGYGVYGWHSGSGVGVYAYAPSGTALKVVGPSTFDSQISSTVTAGGAAPISVVSTTKCPNLNADLLDGLEATDFYRSTNPNGYITAASLSGYATTGHTHSEYAASGHTHSNYVNAGAGNTFTFSGGTIGGTATATLLLTNKPGASGSTNVWIKLTIDSTTLYIPVWT